MTAPREASAHEVERLLTALEQFEPVVAVRPCPRCATLTLPGVFCADCRRLRVVA